MTFNGLVKIYRSTDRGENWQKVFNLMSYGYETSLAVDSSNGVYYGDIDVGLYKSTDRGTSWYKTNLVGGASAIAIISGNRICVGGSQTLSISTDGGQTWSASQVRTDCGNVASIIEDSQRNIYAGFYGTFKGVVGIPSILTCGGGIYISFDSGKTWNTYGLDSLSILSIATGKKNFLL